MKHSLIESYEYVDGLEKGVRQYDDSVFQTGRGIEAKYVRSETDSGNPFIEALPAPRSIDELKIACQRGIPGFSREKELKKPILDQIQSISRLRQVRFQLPINYELEIECYMALINSYRLRKIFRDNDIQLKYEANNKSNISDGRMTGKEDDAANAGFAIIGYSGCGKSSAIGTLFENYPQYLIHHGKGVATYPQIVYLVVQCPPHSNFRGLYKNIGVALDRALGNVKPVYALELDAGERGNLSKYNDKVRTYIELFSIGIIVFDEIQHLNFNTSLENSFESLLELCNQTKVAFAVVGTEDANIKIFGNLRQARRLGGEIHADNYCDDKNLFSFYAKKLFDYQWFDPPVKPTGEIIDALYDCSKGIIDQLVGTYMYMNIDYVRKKTKPTINAKYVYDVAEKHYPGIQNLLKELKDKESEKQRAKLMEKGNLELARILSSEKDQASLELTRKSCEDKTNDYLVQAKEAAVTAITMVTSDFTPEAICCAADKVLNTESGKAAAADASEFTKLVFAKLKNPTANTKKKAPHKSEKISIERCISYLSTGTDDELLGS